MNEATTTCEDTNTREAALTQVATEVSVYYEERFGRAPDDVTAAYSTADCLVVVARGVLTETERAYTTRADQLSVRECRTLFQYADPDGFAEPVERLVGRRVVGLVSGIDIRRDIATETFMLEPETPR